MEKIELELSKRINFKVDINPSWETILWDTSWVNCNSDPKPFIFPLSFLSLGIMLVAAERVAPPLYTSDFTCKNLLNKID